MQISESARSLKGENQEGSNLSIVCNEDQQQYINDYTNGWDISSINSIHTTYGAAGSSIAHNEAAAVAAASRSCGGITHGMNGSEGQPDCLGSNGPCGSGLNSQGTTGLNSQGYLSNS